MKTYNDYTQEVVFIPTKLSYNIFVMIVEFSRKWLCHTLIFHYLFIPHFLEILWNYFQAHRIINPLFDWSSVSILERVSHLNRIIKFQSYVIKTKQKKTCIKNSSVVLFFHCSFRTGYSQNIYVQITRHVGFVHRYTGISSTKKKKN